MGDRPDGVRLLELARKTLLEDLSAHLPAGQRYIARLVANAMAIAARELETGETPQLAARVALETLLGEEPDEAEALAQAETVDEALQRLNWRLTAEIRSGGRDAHPKVHEMLRKTALARLKIVNPRALVRGSAPSGK